MESDAQRASVATGLAVGAAAFALAVIPATCLGMGYVALCPSLALAIAAVVMGRSLARSDDPEAAAAGRRAMWIGGAAGTVSGVITVLMLGLVVVAIVLLALGS